MRGRPIPEQEEDTRARGSRLCGEGFCLSIAENPRLGNICLWMPSRVRGMTPRWMTRTASLEHTLPVRPAGYNTFHPPDTLQPIYTCSHHHHNMGFASKLGEVSVALASALTDSQHKQTQLLPPSAGPSPLRADKANPRGSTALSRGTASSRGSTVSRPSSTASSLSMASNRSMGNSNSRDSTASSSSTALLPACRLDPGSPGNSLMANSPGSRSTVSSPVSSNTASSPASSNTASSPVNTVNSPGNTVSNPGSTVNSHRGSMAHRADLGERLEERRRLADRTSRRSWACSSSVSKTYVLFTYPSCVFPGLALAPRAPVLRGLLPCSSTAKPASVLPVAAAGRAVRAKGRPEWCPPNSRFPVETSYRTCDGPRQDRPLRRRSAHRRFRLDEVRAGKSSVLHTF